MSNEQVVPETKGVTVKLLAAVEDDPQPVERARTNGQRGCTALPA